MSFLSKVSKKWKKVKHKIDGVASPSHIAAKAILGKKKGTAVMDEVDIAIGSAYTFGLGKVAADLGKGAEGKAAYKKAKKAAKKAAKQELLAKKKGLVSFNQAAPQIGATAGFMGNQKSPYATTLTRQQAVNSPNVAPTGIFGGLQSGLESVNQALGRFVDDPGMGMGSSSPFDGGGEYYDGDMQDDIAAANGAPNGTNPLTFVLVGLGVVVLAIALKK